MILFLKQIDWHYFVDFVSLVFSHLGFWSGNFFLIVPFPNHCLLVPFYMKINKISHNEK